MDQLNVSTQSHVVDSTFFHQAVTEERLSGRFAEERRESEIGLKAGFASAADLRRIPRRAERNFRATRSSCVVRSQRDLRLQGPFAAA